MSEALSQPVTPPPSSQAQIGLSYAEVLCLLNMGSGVLADRTREQLRLDSVDDLEKVALIGASCLMARQLLAFTEDGKSVTAVEQALYIRDVLTNSYRWTEFQVTDGGDGGDTGFFIESPEGQVLVQPRAFDTWWFVLLHPDAPSEDIFAATALEWAGSAPEMAVFIRSQTVDLDRSFTIHVDSQSWSYAFGTTNDSEPQKREERVLRADVDAALKSFAEDMSGVR